MTPGAGYGFFVAAGGDKSEAGYDDEDKRCDEGDDKKQLEAGAYKTGDKIGFFAGVDGGDCFRRRDGADLGEIHDFIYDL